MRALRWLGSGVVIIDFKLDIASVGGISSTFRRNTRYRLGAGFLLQHPARQPENEIDKGKTHQITTTRIPDVQNASEATGTSDKPASSGRLHEVLE